MHRDGHLEGMMMDLALDEKTANFQLLDDQYRDQTIALASRLFAQKERMASVLAISEDEICPLMTATIDISIQQRMGLIAVDPTSNEVVAFACSKDLTTPLTTAFPLSPKIDPIIDVLEIIESDFKNRYQPKTGEYGHWFMMGVSASHLKESLWGRAFRGGQLGLQLAKAVVSQSELLGYRKYFTQCTSERTAQILRLITTNSEPTLAVEYASFVDLKTGTRPFANLRGSCQGFVSTIARQARKAQIELSAGETS